jgi:hypothetical protein
MVSADVTYRLDGSTVVLTKHLERKGGLYGKADYEEIRRFYRKVHEAERRSVMLKAK